MACTDPSCAGRPIPVAHLMRCVAPQSRTGGLTDEVRNCLVIRASGAHRA